MKIFPFLVFIVSLCYSTNAQNLNNRQLDSVYNLFLQIRPHSPAAHHNEIQSAAITHIKCGLGIVSSIKSNLNQFTIAQQSVLKSLLDRPSSDTSIVSPSGFFRVHFTISDTPNYIPDKIRSTITTPGEMQLLKKEYLDSLTIALDSAYNFEINYLGYPPPPPDNGAGGDDKYDIYITNLGNEYGETDPEDEIVSNSGRFTSFMQINVDFGGFYTDGINAARVTVSHEFHHSVQIGNYIYRYNLDGFFYELTSTSMEHFVYPTIRDYVQYLPSYFSDTQNSLGLNGTLQEYALAIWNIFLKDSFGYDIIKTQWELMPQMRALQAISTSLSHFNTSFGEQLNNFGIWTYYTSYRNMPGKYFEDAIYYPVIQPVAKLQITSSVTSVQSISAPVSNNFITIINTQNLDSLVALITNADIGDGINSTDTTLPFTYSLYNYAQNGTNKLTPDYYESFTVDKPAFWVTSAILNNKIVDSSNFVVQNVNYVFPSPFNYKKNAFIYIPAQPDAYGNTEVNIYNIAMKLVYSTNQKVNYIYGQKVVSWNGYDNHNQKLSSGVYIYVTKSGNDIKKGKLVIFNE
jgi:hypothetical protein